MFVFEIIEVGIGMVFVWMVLALASMTVQEWLAGVFKVRSSFLEEQIRHILNDPPEKWLDKNKWLNKLVRRLVVSVKKLFRANIEEVRSSGIILADKVYDHPLIKSLSKRGKRPSYIPDRTFSLVLFDILMTAGTDASIIQKGLNTWEKALDEKNLDRTLKAAVESELIKIEAVIKNYAGQPEFRNKLESEVKRMVNQLTGRNVELDDALNNLLKNVLPQLLAFGTDQLQTGINKLWDDNRQIAQAMTSLFMDVSQAVEAGEAKLAAIRTNVETWFNDSMDRLSGYYKRGAQTVGFLLGLLLAVAFNVDSISVFETLWREPVVREALVEQVGEFEMVDVSAANGDEGKDPGEAWDEFYAQFEGINLPLGWDFSEPPCVSASGQPLGFNYFAVNLNRQCIKPVDLPGETAATWNWFVVKIFGWLVSGVAAAQGATYWFDILKKLFNIRSSGKNPTEEKSKAGAQKGK